MVSEILPTRVFGMSLITEYTTFEDAQKYCSKQKLWELFDGTRESINIAHECVDRHPREQIAVQIADIRKLLAQPNLSPKLRAFYQGEIKRLDQEHAQILTCLLQHRVKQRGKQLADLKRSIQNKPKTTPVPAKPSVLPSRTARSSPRPRR